MQNEDVELIDLDKEVIREMIERSRRLQKLPAGEMRAILGDLRPLPSGQGAEAMSALEWIVKTKGLEEEWEEFREEMIKIMKRLYRWEGSTRQMHRVSLLARSLWKEDFDGWLGDLQEARWELIDAGYSWWRVSCITWGRLALLFWSLIRVIYQDLNF